MDVKVSIISEKSADVVVVGGGTAGVFAAISAARCGAKTILVEKNAMLGGTAVAAGVNFPGLFFAWGKQIISGPCWEAIERTAALGGCVLPKISFKPQNHWDEQILLDPFIYTAVLLQTCKEAGVEIICNAMPTAVYEEEDGVKLLVTCKEGAVLINAASAVDATADANLCLMAGCEVVKSRIQQPATLRNFISGYEVGENIRKRVREKFAEEDLPEHITAELLIDYLDGHCINMHIPCVDADTSEGRTALDIRAVNDVFKIYSFFKSIEGLENIRINYLASETGVRESNRIVGENVITAEDYISGRFYPDSICYAFYPVDLHVMDGIEQVFLGENVVPKVPFSALIPKGKKRILCVGRCISSDTHANSAVRVQAVCMATGQAAGCAAAIAVTDGVCASEVGFDRLCDTLKKLGATVPSPSDFEGADK